MASASETFFDDEQHEASRLKIQAYEKYLQPFAYKVMHYYRRIWVVDGFAGAGQYGPEANEAAGSPLVAARFAHKINIARTRDGREMLLINVERDPATFMRLQRTLAGFGPLVTNMQGRFQDRLDDVMELVGRDPVFIFLDAFGMESADIRLIEKILERRGGNQTITELLIHFSDRTLARVAGHLSPGRRDAQAERAGQTKLRRMDEMIGTSWWRGAFTNPQLKTTEARCDAAAEIYMQQLRQRGIRFVHELRMRDAYDASPRYRLVFTTRSAHGSFLMSDIAAGHEAELFKARFDGTFEISWEEQKRRERRDRLRSEIHSWGLDRGFVTPEDVHLHFGPVYFGKWRTSDYDNCLRELVDLGGIDRVGRSGINRKERLRFAVTLQADLFDSVDSAVSDPPGTA